MIRTGFNTSSNQIHSIQAGMCRVYFIQNNSSCILVDAGSPGNEKKILQKMEKIGCTNLRLIFITHGHFDHYGSAAALRRLTNAPIAIHRADSSAMARGETPLDSVRSWGRLGKPLLPLAEFVFRPEKTKPDIVLEDGDNVKAYGCDGIVVHTPGHTRGSSCLVVNDSLVFVGDVVSSRFSIHHQNYYAYDWQKVKESTERLKNLGAAWIYPGHGRPFRGERFR